MWEILDIEENVIREKRSSSVDVTSRCCHQQIRLPSLLMPWKYGQRMWNYERRFHNYRAISRLLKMICRRCKWHTITCWLNVNWCMKSKLTENKMPNSRHINDSLIVAYRISATIWPVKHWIFLAFRRRSQHVRKGLLYFPDKNLVEKRNERLFCSSSNQAYCRSYTGEEAGCCNNSDQLERRPQWTFDLCRKLADGKCRDWHR